MSITSTTIDSPLYAVSQLHAAWICLGHDPEEFGSPYERICRRCNQYVWVGSSTVMYCEILGTCESINPLSPCGKL